MATPNYEVNYDDERFAKVESDKQDALTELEQTYAGMIDSSDKYFDEQIQASKDWADQQSQLQQEQTDHAINKIEQEKDQSHKDYLKEQSGAYVDWKKQSNEYGSEAEKMAASGLTGTGYSESSQVSMYNTYQNRVATARESFAKAVLNYDNAIKDAQLQNNSILAEIAYNSLQQQLELSLQGFQYKNNLILEQASKKTELNNTYYNRYLDVLNQINQENALAEDVRQFEETMDFNATQAELDRQHQSNENELNRVFQAQQAELDRNFQEKQAELNREHDFALTKAKTEAEKELLEIQHQQAMAKLAQQHAYDKAMLEKEYALKRSYSSSSTVSGGSTTILPTTNASTAATNQSILDLGYGPINGAELDRLVASGQVEQYTENGIVKFRKTKTGQSYDLLTKYRW